MPVATIWRKTVGESLLMLALVCLGSRPALAQIRTDGSVGPAAQTLSAATGQYTLPQSLGKLVGTNLFHSFQDFNINTGETATFTTSTSGISNVISRVTGGNMSNINGTLALKPIDGAPAFWFVNPAGVVFGNGAALDMPGAFHVSTAHYLKFPDGSFYSDTQKVSTFSSAPPEAFGFLGTNRASIQVNGAKLSNGGNQVNMVAGDITIDGGAISNNAGPINLVAVGDTVGEVSAAQGAPVGVNGAIDITNSSQVIAQTSSEVKAGDVQVTGGSLLIDNSTLSSKTAGSGNGGAVRIQVAADMSVLNGSDVGSETIGAGDAGGVSVTAGALSIDNSGLSGDSSGSGRGGAVSVRVAGFMKVLNQGFLSSTSALTFKEGNGGNAGDVFVTAGSLLIDKASINSDTRGGGHAGAVRVNVTGDMRVLNEGSVSSDSTLPLNDGIGGNAGVVSVTAGSLLLDKSFIRSYTWGSGRSGSVGIEVAGDMSVLNESMVSSSTESSGNAGALNVAVAGNISLLSGAQIGSNTIGAGNAGNVVITAGSLLIDPKDPEGLHPFNTGIFSTSQYKEGLSPIRTGDAGIVDIRVVGSVQVLSGGGIESSTVGGGNAGNVSISAGSLLIDQRGNALKNTNISSDSFWEEGVTPSPSGNAGTVNIRVIGELAVLNGGVISSATFSPLGKAGSVKISAGQIVINGEGKIENYIQESLVTASAASSSSGQTGSVLISASNTLKIANGGVISLRNDATVATPGTLAPTTLSVSAPKISLENGGMITTESTGNVPASNISLKFIDKLSIQPSAIITTSAFDGNGGSIDIEGSGLIVLDRSQITTSVTGLTSGNAGSINIAAKTLLMNNGFIKANTAAPLAAGGTISISAEALVPSYGTLLVGRNTPFDFDGVTAGFNVIQAASPTGVSGNISITSPNLDMAGKLAGLKVNLLDTGGFSKNPCASAGKSSFSQTGRGGLPVSSFGALSAQDTSVLRLTRPSSQDSLAGLPNSLIVSNRLGCSLN